MIKIKMIYEDCENFEQEVEKFINNSDYLILDINYSMSIVPLENSVFYKTIHSVMITYKELESWEKNELVDKIKTIYED